MDRSCLSADSAGLVDPKPPLDSELVHRKGVHHHRRLNLGQVGKHLTKGQQSVFYDELDSKTG